MKHPPVICARSSGQARAYTTRRGIKAWTWLRTRRDARDAAGRDVILLPGWDHHWLAPDIQELFAASLRRHGTDIAKAAVSR